MKIHVLEDKLVNQIAAGEVVERPESVVRELVDNSIDADASKIQVWLERGGQKLLKVLDNGTGMSRDDALLAFERHATSKIRVARDLKAISTLGFRGEALASIAAVSKVVLRTKAVDDELGTEIELRGGELRAVNDIPFPVGTEIVVRNLFFNTPARKKFLRTERTEVERIKRWLTQLSLAHPSIHFILTSDGKDLLSMPATDSYESRARSLLKGSTIWFEGSVGHHKVSGLVGHPSLARSSTQYFSILVNRRLVRDMPILHSVKRGFDSTLKDREFPVGTISIETPFDRVDVNVHPQKAEVRFQDQREICKLIEQSVSSAVQEFRGVARWKPSRQPERQVVNAAINQSPLEVHEGVAAADLFNQPPSKPRLEESSQGKFRFKSANELTETAGRSAEAGFDAAPDFEFNQLRYIGQLFECYLLCEFDSDFYLVDMHAAHERYNFNLIRNTLRASNFPSQQLLVPIPLDLFDQEFRALSEITDFLTRFGLEIEPFGSESLVVRAVPTLLLESDISGLLREIAALSLDHFDSQPILERIDSISARLACHASIRSGKLLERQEVYRLFSDLDKSEFQTACPHGRPLLVKFSETEVESWFGRDR